MLGPMPGRIRPLSGLFSPQYIRRVRRVCGSSLLALWAQNEPNGSTIVDLTGRFNGVYSNTTLAQAGIGDGNYAAKYNGTTSVGNFFSSGFQAAFNPTELSTFSWFLPDSLGVLVDGVNRWMIHLLSNANNHTYLIKPNSNNLVQAAYVAGSVVKVVNIAYSQAVWGFLAATVSKNFDRLRGFLNGVQQGSDVTGLGTWSGTLSSSGACLGAQNTTPSGVFFGTLGLTGVCTRELSPTEVARLMP